MLPGAPWFEPSGPVGCPGIPVKLDIARRTPAEQRLKASKKRGLKAPNVDRLFLLMRISFVRQTGLPDLHAKFRLHCRLASCHYLIRNSRKSGRISAAFARTANGHRSAVTMSGAVQRTDSNGNGATRMRPEGKMLQPIDRLLHQRLTLVDLGGFVVRSAD